jgi:uncharacterized membrane-anchored protein YjiN (DUF445 family)
MDQIKTLQEKSKKVSKLLNNEIFNEIIIDDFIKSGILDNAINNSIDSVNTQDQLKARQILHRYLFDIISYAETSQK